MEHTSKATLLSELVDMSHRLGEEWREYLIIGEGNTSAKIDDHTFYVKASGSNLRTIRPDQIVEIDWDKVSALLDGEPTDEDVTRVLNASRVDPTASARPSVETVLHGALYSITDAKVIGHAHPVYPNMVLCSTHARDIVRHLMPDEIVVCGIESVFVPYTDPGVPLAREVIARVREVIDRRGEMPRTIYLQNHGVFALGQTPRQVENIMAMAVKHAKILMGAYGLGGPNFLTDRDIARIHHRPDEAVRQAQFK
jgi:rhamnose utilization protein RhaD (predicted bifunctional aldolase and dehydrogenase)